MNKDPFYFLKKAEQFRNKAKKNAELEGSYDFEESDNFKGLDDFDAELVISNQDFELVETIKPSCKRYYDPETRHYFKTNKISDMDILPIAKISDDIWYPEHYPSDNFFRDPISGKLYRIIKIYDTDGNYYFNYKPINHFAVKQPGTSYYKPSYGVVNYD